MILPIISNNNALIFYSIKTAMFKRRELKSDTDEKKNQLAACVRFEAIVQRPAVASCDSHITSRQA
jgi:hypothetical protein